MKHRSSNIQLRDSDLILKGISVHPSLSSSQFIGGRPSSSRVILHLAGRCRAISGWNGIGSMGWSSYVICLLSALQVHCLRVYTVYNVCTVYTVYTINCWKGETNGNLLWHLPLSVRSPPPPPCLMALISIHFLPHFFFFCNWILLL